MDDFLAQTKTKLGVVAHRIESYRAQYEIWLVTPVGKASVDEKYDSIRG